MKKNKLLLIGLLISTTYLSAQTNPQGNPPANNTNAKANTAWYRGGNNFGQTTPPGANIFGTLWNSPIYTQTVGINRMKLNGNFGVAGAPQYTVNGYGFGNTNTTINTSGYLLLGEDGPTQTGNPSLYTSKGAFSLLHLNGPDNSPTGFVQEYGFRPWMKTGITYTGNNDLMYMGIRQLEDPQDRTEFVTSWSDNSGTSYPGPDDYAFRFVGVDQNAPTTYSQNYDSENDIDGRHIARFTGKGEFGLGPVFGVTSTGSPTYYRPQSIQHIGEDNYDAAWFQMTNTLGTGMTAGDGIRLGIEGGSINQTIAYFRYQENRPIVFQTDWDAATGGTAQGERMRITTLGDASSNVPVPVGASTDNITRVSISQSGSDPIDQPRSLLHLGYNTGLNSFPLGSSDGWRNWMDIGTFTSDGTDNMYVGLKNEGTDRADAVVNWGDNQIPGSSPNGPDNLRFIFTSTTTAVTGQGDPISQSNDGLEIARMVPDQDINGLPSSYGKMGVGDFFAGGIQPVTHKLHVRGNGRFEFVPTDASAEYILLGKEESSANDVSMRKLAFTGSNTDVLLGDGTWGTVNPTGGTDDQLITNFSFNSTNNELTVTIEDGNTATVDLTDLLGTDDQNLTNAYLTGNVLTIEIENGNSVSVNLSDLNLVTANNGLTINPVNNNVQWGQVNTGLGTLAGGELIQDTEIPMNGNNLYFPGGGTFGQDRLTIGNPLLNLDTKVVIWNDVEQYGILSVSNSNHPNQSIAVQGTALGSTNANVGVRGIANMASGNYHTGIRGLAAEGAVWNMGADLDIPATSTYQNYGFHSQVIGSSSGINYGGVISVQGANSGSNFGLNVVCNSGNYNYGVYSSAPVAPNSYAGYFNGDVFVTGTISPSDQNMKTNIQNYDSSLYVISQLQPRSFKYTDANFQGMTLPEGHQYGLIAQEVEQVLPTIVSNNVHPAQYDTTGNMIHPEYQFKGVDYEALIPILLGGVKEQQEIIEAQTETISSQDSLINDLNARLTSLESCLSNILPELCQVNSTAIMQNDKQTQEAIVHQLEVILNDESSIVLEQNVPNPFAEQTVINYYIPSTVQKAQIHFYNLEGQLINMVDVNEFGNGQLKVFGSDLSSGVYSYTLVVDGKIIATKKMVKTN